MKANPFQENKLDLIPPDQPKICQNTSTGSFQSHSNQNWKINNSDKLQLCINQVKTHSLNQCNSLKIKQKKSQEFSPNILLDHTVKKHSQLGSHYVQQITENMQINNPENRKKVNSLIIKNYPYPFQSSTDDVIGDINLNYNNMRIWNNQNFQYDKKINQKNQKLFISHQTKFPKKNLIQMLKNQGLTSFITGTQILYPVPDHILKTVQEQSKNDGKLGLKSEDLPMGFCYLIEMLNLSFVLPQVFRMQEETISKLGELLQAPSQNEKNQNKFHPTSFETQLNQLMEESFRRYMKQLSGLIIQELSSEKLQSLTSGHTYNVLSLSKFCQQNQLLDFVFQYNWPLILLELAKISLEESKENFSKYQKCIQLFKNNILLQKYEIPSSFQLRFEIISLLIESYSGTSSFRELFNKKVEQSRNGNRKKSTLQQQKKNIQQMIKKVQSGKIKKTKKISKRKNSKYSQQLSEEQEIQNNDDRDHKNHKDETQQVGKLHRQLVTVNADIQKQNRQDSLSACHYLGKDSSGHLYWYISYFPQKLFIEVEKRWSYFSIEQISHFLQLLQRKGIDENRLYQRIQEYYLTPLNKHLSKMEIETEENNTHVKPLNIFNSSTTMIEKPMNHCSDNVSIELEQLKEEEYDSSKNSLDNGELLIGLGVFKVDKDSLFRMIELGEKKMTEYLKERNSRWGSEQNKQHLFATIKGAGLNWLEEAKRQISTFNEKICVVEIEYKVYVEQSVEQVDSKVKKIQTKIWGINEKYKHNWYDFVNSASSFTELFFAVSVLYSLIKKYTSKHRKLRKEYQEIKQKSVWKTTPVHKYWKQAWNDQCEVCGVNGEVLCCDHCPKVYHLACINLTEVPLHQFKCKSCKQQITTRNQFKSLANTKKKGKR